MQREVEGAGLKQTLYLSFPPHSGLYSRTVSTYLTTNSCLLPFPPNFTAVFVVILTDKTIGGIRRSQERSSQETRFTAS